VGQVPDQDAGFGLLEAPAGCLLGLVMPSALCGLPDYADWGVAGLSGEGWGVEGVCIIGA
jgi:hypothetical protein